MKISIAMCTYNGAEYLREQLDSFAAQSVLPDELIVCDDGSTDATVAILKEFAASAAFAVKIYENERNLGYIKNFEQAIGLCTGEIIFLSDQDDVWHAEKVAVFKAKFADPEVGMVYADAAVVDENLQSLDRTMWEYTNFSESERRKFADGEDFDVLLVKGYVLGSSMAFRADLRDIVLPIPLDVYYIHDNWIALMVSAVAKTELIEKCLIKYRQHQQQSSTSIVSRSQPTAFSEARQRSNEYEGVIKQLNIAEDRLVKSSYDKRIIESDIAKIKRVRSHLAHRSTLPKSFFRRLPVVVSELSKRHYHKYSNGFYSAAKDLF